MPHPVDLATVLAWECSEHDRTAEGAPARRQSMGAGRSPAGNTASVTEPWSPLTVAALNDYDVRVVRTRGTFTRHTHPETDELFLVLAGELTIELDGGDVTLGPGQLHVVPRGVTHCPRSEGGAEVLLVEPRATVNTGDAPGPLTAERRVAPDPPPPRSPG